MKQIGTALISVFNKEGLLPVLAEFSRLGIKMISTGGTYDFIKEHAFDVQKVDDFTGFPPVFGGRVKTLHPMIFGSILYRRNQMSDLEEKEKHKLGSIDLVMVDLYPFSETVKSGASEEEIIEKIDIGGISLIRAAAKNFEDVLVIPSREHYSFLLNLLKRKNGISEPDDRKYMATHAFKITSEYDSAIFNYFSFGSERSETLSLGTPHKLRYGENPHQSGYFYGNLNEFFSQLHGKELSYNNILDIDAALKLILDLNKNTIAVIKHLNPCGVASRDNISEAWHLALEADPVSAFGGIIATRARIDEEIAAEIDKLFFEILVAGDYSETAIEILARKKNRILLKLNTPLYPANELRSALSGYLYQNRNTHVDTQENLKVVTFAVPSANELEDLIFANTVVKHVKSNAIVLVKDKRLIGIGTGQTSRVDAVEQAIHKARRFNLDMKGAVMASDAYFPFADSVQIASENGITAVIQPGGSIRDQESIDFCNKHGMAMVFTGIRHFKH